MTLVPKRRHPAHPQPIVLSGRSTIPLLTICVDRRRPLLANSPAHELIVRRWREASAWKVGRYVVMPDHLHFFCGTFDPRFTLKQWMMFWRNAVTRAWPCASEKPVWQTDYWDTQLRRGESYAAKWEYLRQNPVRRGLVSNPDDWPYQGELEILPWLEEEPPIYVLKDIRSGGSSSEPTTLSCPASQSSALQFCLLKASNFVIQR